MSQSRKVKTRDLIIAILSAGFVTGLIAGFFNGSGETMPVWVRWSLGIALVGASIGSFWYWKRLDETAREAHKFSWLWGSTFGLVAAFGASALSMAGLDIVNPIVSLFSVSNDQQAVFFSGAYAMLLAQVIGYGLVWAFWWLRMR